MEKYALKTEDGFFAYESGHYTCDATFTSGSSIRAATWNTHEPTDKILKAYEYARKEGYNPKLVKVTIDWEEVGFDFEDEIRKNALDKLSEKEKEVLDIAP